MSCLDNIDNHLRVYHWAWCMLPLDQWFWSTLHVSKSDLCPSQVHSLNFPLVFLCSAVRLSDILFWTLFFCYFLAIIILTLLLVNICICFINHMDTADPLQVQSCYAKWFILFSSRLHVQWWLHKMLSCWYITATLVCVKYILWFLHGDEIAWWQLRMIVHTCNPSPLAEGSKVQI